MAITSVDIGGNDLFCSFCRASPRARSTLLIEERIWWDEATKISVHSRNDSRDSAEEREKIHKSVQKGTSATFRAGTNRKPGEGGAILPYVSPCSLCIEIYKKNHLEHEQASRIWTPRSAFDATASQSVTCPKRRRSLVDCSNRHRDCRQKDQINNG